MHRLALIRVSLLYLATLATSATAQSAEEALQRSMQLQQAGDPEGALAAVLQAAKLAPERLDIQSNLALAYLRLGQAESAIPGLQRVREAAPEHAGIAYYLGLALFQAARFQESERELAWVVERQPDNGQAVHLLGLCLLKQGDLDRGIGVLERVVNADKTNRQAAYTLGSAYVKAGQLERAGALVRERLADDDSPEALLIRGSVRLAEKLYGPARALLERASARQPDLPMVHSQTGVALLYLGDHERAAREFLKELSINPSDFNANAFLGWLVQQDGDAGRARKLLENALRQDEFDTGVRYLLAQVHVSEGNWNEARSLLQGVVEAQPAFIPAHVMLARVYAKLKLVDDFRKERDIIERLNARQQERDLEGVDGLYDGTVLSLPQP